MNKEQFKRESSFDYYLQQELKDPEFKKLYDEEGVKLEVAYTLLQLRKKQKMSQAQLAKQIGTTQSNLARIEAGNQNLTIQMMHRIAKALGKELVVKFN